MRRPRAPRAARARPRTSPGAACSPAAARVPLRAPQLHDPDRLAGRVAVHHERKLRREVDLGIALLVLTALARALADRALREPLVAVRGAHAVAVLALDVRECGGAHRIAKATGLPVAHR